MIKDTAGIEKYRIKNGFYGSDASYGANGLFVIPYRRVKLNVIISNQFGWDHLSVSVKGKKRCPKWLEMKFIKDLFFDEDETAIQFHPPKSKYINDNDYVLHIWRPHNFRIPLPPGVMV